jgi:hypothetical protein
LQSNRDQSVKRRYQCGARSEEQGIHIPNRDPEFKMAAIRIPLQVEENKILLADDEPEHRRREQPSSPQRRFDCSGTSGPAVHILQPDQPMIRARIAA